MRRGRGPGPARSLSAERGGAVDGGPIANHIPAAPPRFREEEAECRLSSWLLADSLQPASP